MGNDTIEEKKDDEKSSKSSENDSESIDLDDEENQAKAKQILESMKTKMNKDLKKGDPKLQELEFQVLRDLLLWNKPPDIMKYYMDLVIQCGFIVLFSFVFPLSSLVSYISNELEFRTQIRNLKYRRRFKAEPSNGIGTWMNALENILQLGIIVNCMGIYFTSKVYI